MSHFRQLTAAAGALLVLTTAARGQAYCLTRTCDQTKEDCVIMDGCNMSGKVLYWSHSAVSFDIQKDDSYVLSSPGGHFALDSSGNKIVAITADALEQVAVNAFGRWLNADCGSGMHPSIKIKELPRVDCARPEYNKDQPNANIITFHDSTWPYPANAQDTLALTTVFFNGDTGEIYDANVEINTNLDTFAVGNPTSDQFDLNAVLTHELGHFLGLSHSSLPDATMFSSYMPGMTTLESDDEQGICASLPPGRTTAGDDYTPRHGWSGECGVPETGCCSTAVGANGSSRQALGLLAFGLGLCAFHGRSRLRRSRALRR